MSSEEITGQSSRGGRPQVTAHIGLAFLTLSIVLLACAVTVDRRPDNPELHSLLWVGVVAACSAVGMVSMRSVPVLRVVEAELTRVSHGSLAQSPERWQSARPILGSDPVVTGWNDLLSTATEGSTPARGPTATGHPRSRSNHAGPRDARASAGLGHYRSRRPGSLFQPRHDWSVGAGCVRTTRPTRTD